MGVWAGDITRYYTFYFVKIEPVSIVAAMDISRFILKALANGMKHIPPFLRKGLTRGLIWLVRFSLLARNFYIEFF